MNQDNDINVLSIDKLMRDSSKKLRTSNPPIGIPGKRVDFKVDKKKFQKMIFIMSALEQGWKIRKTSKNEDKYIFIKKHERKKEIFLDSYLERFIESNIDLGILSSGI